MRLSFVMTAVLVLSTTLAFQVVPNSDMLQVAPLDDLYLRLQDITDDHVYRRDEDSSTIASLLGAVNNSGILIDILHEVASSETQMNNLVDTLVGVIQNRSLSGLGLNISINTSEILDKVLDLGIVNNTLDLLLLDVDNRNYLADNLGGSLARQVWVAQLLTDLGNGAELSIDHIADVIKNTKSKASNYDEINPYQTTFGKRADENEYAGLASEFLNNIVNTVLNSQLALTSIDSIIKGLDDSGIITATVLQVLNDTAIKDMVLYIAVRVYESGVLDDLDLDHYYEWAKKKDYLSDAVQLVLTEPTYSPPLARIFQRMEMNGVFQQIQWNMYGGPDN